MQTASVIGRTFESIVLEELGWTLTRMLPHTERLTSQFAGIGRSLGMPRGGFRVRGSMIGQVHRSWEVGLGACVRRMGGANLAAHLSKSRERSSATNGGAYGCHRRA